MTTDASLQSEGFIQENPATNFYTFSTARLASIEPTQRLSFLRKYCRVRDRYRRVILHRFDSNEAVHRYTAFGDATDDDGRLVKNEEEEPVDPEVPHITCYPSNDAVMQLVLLPLALFN